VGEQAEDKTGGTISGKICKLKAKAKRTKKESTGVDVKPRTY
jgi:hypothetical protein